MEKWHTKKLEEVFKELKTSENGLNEKEAKERLKKFGKNELVTRRKISALRIFLRQFSNFLVLMLLIAGVISLLIAKITDASVIFVFLFVITTVGFVQEYRAEKAMEALKKLAAPKATVIREGKRAEIPASELVPGDIILLEEGDRVPADARLIEAMNLKVDESSLTGESIPVTKDAKFLKDVELAERRNMVFLGTIVSYGRAKAVVVSTGMQTEIGNIAKLIQIEEREITPLQIQLNRFGKWLGAIALSLCVIAFVIGWVRGIEKFEMFLTAVALAVSAVPQGLPIVITVTLALGMHRMAKHNALVRRLVAVETLGCATVIAADKTGTMTTNEMTVRKIFCGNKMINVSGAGFEPKGEFSSLDEDVKLLLKIGLLCNNANLEFKEGKWNVFGDPTEGALVVAAAKANLWKEKIEVSYPRIAEFPFSSERKMMTTIHKTSNKIFAFVKGAPETILELCSSVKENGKIRKITEEDKKKILDVLHQMTANGLRTLGFAYKEMEKEIFIPSYVEKNLIFVGLAGMIDPPRPEVRNAIELCKQAGIKVIMLTGDHKLTAIAVAKDLGLLESSEVLTGSELDKMSDEELEKRIENISVFARVSPSHKLRIVKALQKKGHVVAVTGDGVNDAPALKKADIGVAMGIKGTDVAKEASEMVLMDDNFATITKAVEEGRGIYDNIRKFVRYALSVNFSEIFFVSIAVFAGLPLPLLPLQILWINLLTDGAPSLSLSVDPKDPEIMKRKPREKKHTILHKMVLFIIAAGCLALLTEMGVFVWELFKGSTIEKARTMAFTTAIMFELFFVFNCRSEKLSVFKLSPFSNKWLVFAVIITFLLQAMVIYVPFFNSVFGTVPIGLTDWLIIILLCSSGLLLSPSIFLA
jgi:Ca2+-transporting ATPase